MTILDSRPTAPEPEDPTADPRDPRVRLASLFDEGSLRLLTEADASGALSGVGRVEGLKSGLPSIGVSVE